MLNDGGVTVGHCVDDDSLEHDEEARWPSDPKHESSTIKYSFDTTLQQLITQENGVEKGE